MRLTVRKSEIKGFVKAPSSKSLTHREMILSALSLETSRIKTPLFSEDTNATLNALKKFGAEIRRDGDDILITGGDLHAPENVIDCKNSGTTMRLLTGVAAQISGTTSFTGDASLSLRPMEPLLKALEELGCKVSSENRHAPFSITGPLSGRRVSITGSISSQFISALLLSASLGTKSTSVQLTEKPKSEPYIKMTISAMRERGVFVDEVLDGYYIYGGQKYQAIDKKIFGDYSSAAFLFAAAALAGKVTVTNLALDDTQGDKAILTILKKLLAKVTYDDEKICVEKSDMKGGYINLSNTPDLFPIAALLASQADGTTKLSGAKHLRFKESDRIKATKELLTAMGASVLETEDGCIINGPAKLHGAVIHSNDHRIIMTAAVAGLIADGETIIENSDCCKVSYPDFVKDMKNLGADMRET